MAEFSNVPSFFESFSQQVSDDLMTQQLAPNQPEPAQGIFTASDPILADRLVRERLTHLDPELYDLREQSHLMKLFKVLLGGAGLGGLRRQTAVVRLQTMFSGMHFLDLDRFYGALFGIQRIPSEAYRDQNFDPYSQGTDAATWEEIHARDASYRNRLVTFARSIPLGGTYVGIKAMAEALLGVECEIYESWALLDEVAGPSGQTTAPVVFTFGLLETVNKTWASFDGQPWSTWGGENVVQVGRAGLNTRGDFVLQPKREITLPEQYQLVRVIDRFRPAGTQFTVDPKGVSLRIALVPRAIAADSEYWEVTSRTTPNKNLVTPTGGLYPSDGKQARPAFSSYQSETWSYNGDVTTVSSYVQNGGQVMSRNNDQLVAYSDGTSHRYTAADAVMTVAQAMSAKLVGDGVLTSGPYSANRGSAATVGAIG